MKLKDREVLFALNWGDAAASIEIPLRGNVVLKDLFSGEDYGTLQGTYVVKDMPGRSGRVFEARRG